MFIENTNELIYEGIMCDDCGKAKKVGYYLVDVWLSSEEKCNKWGVKDVTIEF